MIKSSSKYNMAYFTIEQLERRIDIKNLHTSLWRVTNSTLTDALSGAIQNSENKELSFYKDKSDTKDVNGATVFKGLFMVSAEKKLNLTELQLLFNAYKSENPHLFDENCALSSVSNTTNSSSQNTELSTLENKDVSLSNNGNNYSTLDAVDLSFGIVDDLHHLKYLSTLEDVEIIENIGDFKKVYFSIPTHREREALAYSVTMLPVIKDKKSLLDYCY